MLKRLGKNGPLRLCTCGQETRLASRVVAVLVLATAIGYALPAIADDADAGSERTSLPNIVLIMADDMGYGDLSCYNSDSKIATHNIDRLAEQGVRFTDAHSPGALCVPTRYGLMTGRYPFRDPLPVNERACINANRVTIGALLTAHSYRTAMVGKWHLGFEGGRDQEYTGRLRGGPCDRGFDHYFGIHASLDIPPYFYIRDHHAVMPPTGEVAASASPDWTPIQGAFWRAGHMAPDFRHEEVLPRFGDEAVRVLREQRDAKSPFFLYVALPAPHTPWLPLEPFRGRSGAGLYGDFVLQVDALVGSLLDELEQSGDAENTLVIFTSDNGPVWFESDSARWHHRATGPYRGMKADAWEGGHRMPFIARWPGHVPSNKICHSMICHIDLLATFADIVGTAPPKECDSRSLLPALQAPEEHPEIRDTLVLKQNASVVRHGPWKLITHAGSGGFTGRGDPLPADAPPGQLYYLTDDPGETDNLWHERSERVKELTALLESEKTRFADEAQ